MIKKTFLALAWAGWLHAQEFEGTITYKVTFTGEAAAQMGEMIKQYLPEAQVAYYAPGYSRVEYKSSNPQVASQVILMDYKSKRMYMLDVNAKTAKAYPIADPDQAAKKNEKAPTITEEKEVITIAGYKAKKYKVIVSTPQGEMEMFVWNSLDLKLPKDTRANLPNSSNVKLEGIPLKTISRIPGADLSMIMTATQVKKQTLSKELFSVPPDYSVEEGDAEDDK
ncbi:MAG: DUF4412 domain-containing protein [Bacteroidia bacterium]